ncbi:MAG: SurA N-terminal domain-containing protein [Patescibacteria group bacterium]
MPARKEVKSAKKENYNQIFFQLLKTPKVFIPLITVVIFGLLFSFKGLFIVALVNGQPISRIAVIQTLEKRDGKQALTSFITQALILQEAQKRNIDVSTAEINDLTKKIQDDLKKQGQSLDQALSTQGMTRKDLEDQLRIRKLVEKMLSKDVKVTDKEVNDYIEKNKATIPQDMKPDEVKKTAREQLEQQKLAQKAQSFIESLQSKAKINYFVNY